MAAPAMESAMTEGRLPEPPRSMSLASAGRDNLQIRSLQLQTLQWEFDRSHLYEQASFTAATGAGFAARR